MIHQKRTATADLPRLGRVHRLCRKPPSGRLSDQTRIFGIDIAKHSGRHLTPPQWRVLEPESPIPLESVTLVRAEGPIHLCGNPLVFGGRWLGPSSGGGEKAWICPLTEAETTLTFQWAGSVHPGGCDKCDAKIQWADGNSWSFRFDLGCDGTDAGERFGESVCRRFLFHAGLYRPDHMSEEDYGRLLNLNDGRLRDGAREIVAKYEY